MNPRSESCEGCKSYGKIFPFTMAFQPLVHLGTQEIYAYEALVRGVEGQGAPFILSQVTPENRYAFDQACRVKAIELAARLGMKSKLSINFLPNAVYRAEACIKLTLATAERHGFPVENIIFELTEDERANDLEHLKSIFSEYRRRGFLTALDDFGAGYASLELLVAFQPDIIKLDMGLIRDIDTNRVKQTVVSAMMNICRDLNIMAVGEGVETREELAALTDLGVEYFQGYLFAKPALESLPDVNWNVNL